MAEIDRSARPAGFLLHVGETCFATPGFDPCAGWQDYLIKCVFIAQSKEMDAAVDELPSKNIDN